MMKKCPFCAESIQEEAVKCRFCGEFLDGRWKIGAADGGVPSKKMPWFFNKSSLVVSLLVAGPFMLPLVWFNPKLSRTAKIIWTVGVIVLTVLLIKLSADLLTQANQKLQSVLGGS